MSKQLKQYIKNDLKARLGEDRDVIVVGVEKLTVARANDLRTILRKDGASMTGLRNRVARHAFDELGMDGLGPVVQGMSAVAHGGSEGVLSVARLLSEWTKKNKDGGIRFLGGYMEGRVLEPADVERLATMPSRDQLLSMIASAVVAPMQNIAGQLNELLSGVARAVDAVREKREQEGDPVAAPAAAAEDPAPAEEPAPEEETKSAAPDEAGDAPAEAPAAEGDTNDDTPADTPQQED